MNKQIDYKLLPTLAAKSEAEWKRFFSKNKKKLEGMDLQVHAIHDKISGCTDCLTCANCCKSIGPRITDKDIERIAHKLKMKEVDFIARYLHIDDDQWYVFKE